ncbi:MAG: hypothetical protein JXB38_17405 [Anaerolineales bacterium]|nr:hypothetical protein [Anaerolineales bacterium]
MTDKLKFNLGKSLPFLQIFKKDGKTDKLLLSIFILINLLVLVNALLHPPEIGYDANDHLEYVRTLPFQLPDKEENREFFSPPLPYFVPSLVDEACVAIFGEEDFAGPDISCRRVSGKFAQFVNLLLSVGLTFLLLHIAELLHPGDRILKLTTLALLAVLSVYYKTFAQVRGEPYVAFFTILAIFLVLKILTADDAANWKAGIPLGIALGCALLSRQWSILIFPALFSLGLLIFFKDKASGIAFGKIILTGLLVAFVVSSWFYFSLYFRYGSFTAFNRPQTEFAFSNMPRTFYRNTGLGELQLFKTPRRPFFDNQFIPTFYSDTWGDYWGYWILVRRTPYRNWVCPNNIQEITPYLGRANFVSLIPTLILAGGFLLGSLNIFGVIIEKRKSNTIQLFHAFLILIVLFSFAGYLYFVISYPFMTNGDTIKGTYMLHMFIALVMLGAAFLRWVTERIPKSTYIYFIILALVFLHNLPVFITRYYVICERAT